VFYKLKSGNPGAQGSPSSRCPEGLKGVKLILMNYFVKNEARIASKRFL